MIWTNLSNADKPRRRSESDRFKGFAYDDLLKRDKVHLDIFWLRDESLEDSANLSNPDVLALGIAEDLEAASEQFAAIAADLSVEAPNGQPTLFSHPRSSWTEDSNRQNSPVAFGG
jgi:hypothetical protein